MRTRSSIPGIVVLFILMWIVIIPIMAFTSDLSSAEVVVGSTPTDTPKACGPYEPDRPLWCDLYFEWPFDYQGYQCDISWVDPGPPGVRVDIHFTCAEFGTLVGADGGAVIVYGPLDCSHPDWDICSVNILLYPSPDPTATPESPYPPPPYPANRARPSPTSTNTPTPTSTITETPPLPTSIPTIITLPTETPTPIPEIFTLWAPIIFKNGDNCIVPTCIPFLEAD